MFREIEREPTLDIADVNQPISLRSDVVATFGSTACTVLLGECGSTRARRAA